jgi:hypothetical protein
VKSAVVIVLVIGASVARADDRPPAQIQADLGLAVVGLGYEQPLGDHLAVMGEAQIFGTYFLPWFDAGNNVTGGGVEVRGTWFRGEHHHGLYAAGYLRYDEVSDEADHSALGFCGGLVAGWAFPVSVLDVRIGGGLQYMRYESITTDIDTPFIELDLIVGYALHSRTH